MVEHQGPRRHADYMIVVDGVDISPKIDPFLISLQVIDSFQKGNDQCNIELDDSNGVLAIPPDGASLNIFLGWASEGPRLFSAGKTPIPSLPGENKELPFGGPGMCNIFSGIVTSVESGFGRRGGGRRLWIEGTGGDVKQLGKQIAKNNWGEGDKDDSGGGDGGGGGGGGGGSGGGGGGGGGGDIPMHTVMTDMFGKAGMGVQMSPKMMQIARNYWHVNDSPTNFAARMAQETGGLFKVSNNTAIMIGRGEGVNGMGQAMPLIEAIWGINLIGWRIKPYTGRAQWGGAQKRFFKIGEAAWDSVKASIGGDTPFGGSSAVSNAVHSVADSNAGEQENSGDEQTSTSKRGHGWILLNGEPRCIGGGHVLIKGARAGVDGTYLIMEAEHNYTRQGGYTTRANVEYPIPEMEGWKYRTTKGATKNVGPPMQYTDPTKPGYVQPQFDNPRAPGYFPAQSTDPSAPNYVELGDVKQ
jgi:hypothetical protein